MDTSPPTATDVLIVGAGPAGLAAAVDAASAGARVVVAEVADRPGGAGIVSGGGCLVAGTPLQRKLGIEDDVELAYQDWASFSEGTFDGGWARLYLERAVEDVYGWLAGLGVSWDPGIVLRQEGNTVPRWHLPNGGGAAIVDALAQAVRSLGVSLAMGHRLTAFRWAGRRVAGAEFACAAGSRSIAAATVIVATGGFVRSADLARRHLPEIGEGSRYLYGGAPFATGDGLRLLERAGADLVGLESFTIYPIGTPDPLDPRGEHGLAVVGTRNIWVDRCGRRFHDEDQRGRSGTAALLSLRPATSWGIFDRSDLDLIQLRGDPRYLIDGRPHRARILEFLDRSPHVERAETIGGLADQCGLPPDALAATVRQWNDWIRDGRERDPDFGRDLLMATPIERPPFFAVRYYPLLQKSLGGVRTDREGRVRRPDGTVIGGLFAAGEVAGMAGGNLNGRAGLEGTMIGPSMFSGRMAGRAAARSAEGSHLS